jgi:hypothetical protein
MPVTLAHLLGIFVCILALVREFPEVMSTVAEGLLWYWAYCRFVR